MTLDDLRHLVADIQSRQLELEDVHDRELAVAEHPADG